MNKFKFEIASLIQMLFICLKQQFGRRFILIPLVVLPWSIYKIALLFESGQMIYSAADAQNDLIGLPLYLLSIGLGIGLIAKEIELRTLEVSYSVSGGVKRLWYLKLLAAIFIIICAECILALVTSLIFTPYPLAALYRAFQGAIFFLVFAMGAGALFRSELAAALVSGTVLLALFPRFHDNRWSPLFDPLSLHADEAGNAMAWLIQNQIGTALIIFALIQLAFFRAERREMLLD